jgi:chromosome segregation ATPase
MPDLNDHERRIVSLEQHVHVEAELRAAQDEDQSSIKQEVRAINTLVKALGETQSEHGYKLNRIDRELGLVRKDVEGLRNDVSGLRADVAASRTDVAGARADVGALRAEMHAEIGGLRTELHTEIGGLRTEMSTRFDQVLELVQRLVDDRGSAA